MATITERVVDDRIVSCKFKACVGRDTNRKQVFRCMTWHPPIDTSITKIRKLAKKAADEWETLAKQFYADEIALQNEKNNSGYTFDRFVNELWIPLCLRDGSHRPSTIAFRISHAAWETALS